VIRKDLSRLGRLGARGQGYRVDELQRALGAILGKEQAWNVVLVGAGKIGTALLTHYEFERRGFHFVAVFDDDPSKVGKTFDGLVVQNVSHLPEALRSLDAEIGVITVPATAAQRVARLLVTNGVRAILNFAPINLSLEGDVALTNVDLAVELEKLCYRLTAAKAGKP
jgi:redox-sensing transcriptional repressor